MTLIRIDQSACKRCKTCVEVCPMAVFELKDKNSETQVIRSELCISCGHCVSNCNQNAIIHSDFPEGTIIKTDQQLLPTYEQTLELFRTRRSIRNYKDKPVEKELIEKIIDASYLAQSAENFQPVQYIVVQNKDTLGQILQITIDYFSKVSDNLHEKAKVEMLDERTHHSLKSIETLLGETKNGRDMFLFDAPCLLIFHSKNDVSFAETNIGLALQNATLIAHSLNLGGFFTGYVVSCCKKDKGIANLLQIPENNIIYGAITLGYPKYKYKNWMIRKKPNIIWQ